MSSEVKILKRVYDRFNARDIDSVLAAMHHDVMIKRFDIRSS